MIQLKNISKDFQSGRETIRPVSDVSLSLEPGKFTVCVGPSGSGKTTLLSILGLLLRPDSGEMTLDDVDVRSLSPSKLAKARASSIGFIFQDFNLLDYLTALDNVRLPRSLAGAGRDSGTAQALLEQVGLGSRLASRAHQLSGGEKQRVAICRALVNEPSVLLADEPTGNLDSRHGEEMLDLLQGLVHQRRMASFIVTHDERIADCADVLYEMSDGILTRRQG